MIYTFQVTFPKMLGVKVGGNCMGFLEFWFGCTFGSFPRRWEAVKRRGRVAHVAVVFDDISTRLLSIPSIARSHFRIEHVVHVSNFTCGALNANPRDQGERVGVSSEPRAPPRGHVARGERNNV